MPAEYYQAAVDFRNLAIALKKITKIKNVTKDYFYGEAELLWKFGDFAFSEKENTSFYKYSSLHEAIENAVAELYLHLEKMMDILEQRRVATLENVKLAEDILRDEKKAAIEAAKEQKRFTITFNNINIQSHLRGKGLL